MKEDELRQYATCDMCKRKIGESGFPMFYKVTVERYVLNLDAIKKQQGMTMMMGGSADLARVMGPDEDLAYQMGEGVVTLCEDCSGDIDKPIARLMEEGMQKALQDEDDEEDQ